MKAIQELTLCGIGVLTVTGTARAQAVDATAGATANARSTEPAAFVVTPVTVIGLRVICNDDSNPSQARSINTKPPQRVPALLAITRASAARTAPSCARPARRRQILVCNLRA